MPLTPKLADCFDFVFVGIWILKKRGSFYFSLIPRIQALALPKPKDKQRSLPTP